MRVITTGTFDGVHTGHAALLEQTVTVARRMHATPAAIIFENHPLEIINPAKVPAMLSAVEDRERAIAAYGVEVIPMAFDERVRRMTARAWLEYLRDNYDAVAVVMGYDNTIGCDGKGLAPEDLERISRETGVRIIRGNRSGEASSSAIRRLIREGEITRANELLGHRYSLRGRVVKGQQLGRTLGFPTANIEPLYDAVIPANGVYAADVRVPHTDGKSYRIVRAVVNIGNRPTVGDNLAPTIEAHLLDFDADLYGTVLTLTFIARLRAERRFPTLDALRAAIAADVAAARPL